jgi:hypothetical protein
MDDIDKLSDGEVVVSAVEVSQFELLVGSISPAQRGAKKNCQDCVSHDRAPASNYGVWGYESKHQDIFASKQRNVDANEKTLC